MTSILSFPNWEPLRVKRPTKILTYFYLFYLYCTIVPLPLTELTANNCITSVRSMHGGKRNARDHLRKDNN